MPSMEDKFNYMQDLDQRIAEARAKVELENSLPEKKMMAPAILDYIVEGDSNLYKSIYDANRQRELQAAQFKQQKELQAAQLENAIRLAQEARAAQESKNASDLELKLQQSSTRRQYAQAMLSKAQAEGDPVAIASAVKEFDLANNEYNGLLKATGRMPEESPAVETPEYDPKKTPAYNLAFYKNVNENSTLDEIAEAREALLPYQTNEVIGRLADLDVAEKKARKMMENKEAVNNAIMSFNTKTGEVAPILHNLGYSSVPSGNEWRLLDPKGNTVVIPKKRSSGSKSSSSIASRIKN